MNESLIKMMLKAAGHDPVVVEAQVKKFAQEFTALREQFNRIETMLQKMENEKCSLTNQTPPITAEQM